ncbi:MAG: imidazole glycerol phosphate synthase subunit HisH [Paracoccaceae bacterium]
MIAIVDYGFGNVRSLSNALDFLGADTEITRDPEVFDAADRIVLPGVGAFGDAIKAIRDLGLEPALNRNALQTRKPMFGICLGMQLFAKSSTEHGGHQGLGWIDAVVDRIRPNDPEVKVPQVGWNTLEIRNSGWLFDGLPAKQNDVYFVHSYHMLCADPADLAAVTNHGGPVTAAISRGNLTATQFHPEKSQDNGLRILQNWLEHDFDA